MSPDLSYYCSDERGEVSRSLPSQLADMQQMMGPEAMGIKQQKYDWWDEKVCRNFLFGTCPHLVFGNTVSQRSAIQSELQAKVAVASAPSQFVLSDKKANE